MSDDLRKKLWASTQWWHNDSELKQAVCDALAAKDVEIKALREQRDELLEALQYYAEKVADLNRYGWTGEKALGFLQGDRGRRAKEAIAKVRGEGNE